MGQFIYIIIAIITYIIFRELYLIYIKEKFTESYDENYKEELNTSKIIEHPKDALIEGAGCVLSMLRQGGTGGFVSLNDPIGITLGFGISGNCGVLDAFQYKSAATNRSLFKLTLTGSGTVDDPQYAGTNYFTVRVNTIPNTVYKLTIQANPNFSSPYTRASDILTYDWMSPKNTGIISDITVTTDPQNAILTWITNTSSQSAPAELKTNAGWTITTNPALPSTATITVSGAGNTVNATIRGLTKGISYTATITLNLFVNDYRWNRTSVTSSSFLIVNPLVTISAVTATISARNVSLVWTVSGLTPIPARLLTQAGWTITTNPVLPSNSTITITNSGNTLTSVITNLLQGTAYTATITPVSSTAYITNPTFVTSPSFISPAPTVTVGTINIVKTSTSATLTWTISGTTIAPTIQTGTAWNITTTPSTSNISITNIGNNFTATMSGLTPNTTYNGSIRLNSSLSSNATVTPTAFSVLTQPPIPYKISIISPQPGTHTANAVTFLWTISSNIQANAGNIPILDSTILKGNTWNIKTSPVVTDSVVSTTLISSTVNTINYSTTISGLLPSTAYAVSIAPGSNANYITIS